MSTHRALAGPSRLLCRSRLRSAARRAYSTTPHDIYDVVCVGGGPAGLSLLTALRSDPATSRLRVALVEAQDLAKVAAFDLPPTQFSNRCSSLTPTSAQFLHTIGAWGLMKRERIQEYQEMQVWDGVSGARISFDWAEEQSAATGRTIAYMAENLNITSGLLRRLRELAGVDVFDNCKVETIRFGEETEAADLREWPVVHITGGRALAARLLVGADGANSPVRAFARIDSRGWDYDRHGVVATLELAAGDDARGSSGGGGGGGGKIAYQRFLPTGPVALLPMPGRHATLVWSTTPACAARLKALAPADLVAMVNAAFRLAPVDLAYMHTLDAGQDDEYRWRVQHAAPFFAEQDVPLPVVGVQAGSVASFPLKMRHVDTYVGERVALVGDAAHTIHPLAGQGLNQGQLDVQSLARAVAFAATHGQDIGAQMSLDPYNNERYLANYGIMMACDNLHKLYSVGSGPLVPLRSFGLEAVNALGPLKRFFMGQAS